MLRIQSARKVRSRRHHHRVGLAVAGGGPIGGIYELGALRAIDEAIEGIDLTRMDVYVGVSSGAFLAAGLANRIDTAEMCRIFITSENSNQAFRPEMFLKPALREYAKRLAQIPRLMMDWLLDVAIRPGEINWSESLGRFGELIPTGIFDNEGVERFLRKIFEAPGRHNDFRELDRPLYVVAVDLDSGHAVRFGAPGHDDIAISKAVQASSALPGFYPPVEIGGRYYVDGALQRTLHASVALDADIDVLLALNPLVPFDASQISAKGLETPASLISGGLPRVLSQTIRAMLYSRMLVGFGKYDRSYDHSDLVLFQPDLDDAEMFFTNVFSFASRQYLCEHAYQQTLDDLRAQREELGPLLERHGLRLRREILDDSGRTLWTGLTGMRPPSTSLVARLNRTLHDLDRLLHPHVAARPRSRKRSRQPVVS